MTSYHMLKIPALAAAMLAEYYAYKAPNPPPKKEEMAKYGGGDWISHVASAAQYAALAFAWSIHGAEIAALLAKDARSPLATQVLSVLFDKPSAVHRLSLNPTFFTGLSALLIGTTIRKACYATLGRHFTFQLSVLKEHKLVTWGPYSIVRHPSYTGMAAAIGGMLITQLAPGSWLRESGVLDTALGRIATGTWTTWLVLIVAGAIRRVPKEDAVLRNEFGQQWDEWAKRTPYALVPYVY